MNSFRLAAALLLPLAACEAPITYTPATEQAAAGEVARPSFTVDDEFWYTTNRRTYVEVYEGEEDGLLLFSRGTGLDTLAYTPDLALKQVRSGSGVRKTYTPDDGRLDFPLRLGKTWQLTYRVFDVGGGPQVQRTRACAVVERGVASVPAGQFEVLRIDCELRQIGVLDPVVEQVYYAPEVGRIILRLNERRGYRERLLEYTRAAPP